MRSQKDWADLKLYDLMILTYHVVSTFNGNLFISSLIVRRKKKKGKKKVRRKIFLRDEDFKEWSYFMVWEKSGDSGRR